MMKNFKLLFPCGAVEPAKCSETSASASDEIESALTLEFALERTREYHFTMLELVDCGAWLQSNLFVRVSRCVGSLLLLSFSSLGNTDERWRFRRLKAAQRLFVAHFKFVYPQVLLNLNVQSLWLENVISRQNQQPQILSGIDGNSTLDEETLRTELDF